MKRIRIGRRSALVGVFAIASWGAFVSLAGAQAPVPTTVRLVIDYGEGVEKHYNAIPHAPGMTVRSALDAAKALPTPRGLAFESKGEGERCILLSIDALKNEGGGQGTRNWLFWVNGVPGDRSFALAPLAPGDTATWRFTTYDALKPAE